MYMQMAFSSHCHACFESPAACQCMRR